MHTSSIQEQSIKIVKQQIQNKKQEKQIFKQIQNKKEKIENQQQNKQQIKQVKQVVFEYYDKEEQRNKYVSYPKQILNCGIQLLNNNHHEPYPIPHEIVSSEYPFKVIRQFLQQHNYNPKAYKLIKPINSKNYQNLVDEKTFRVCEKYTMIQNRQEAINVIELCRFIRFHELHDAIVAAIATQYYIQPNNQKQLIQFKKINKIDQLSSQQICQIIKQYQELFNLIQTKAKSSFVQNNPQNLTHLQNH